jgi:hypothetical protein
MLRWPSIRLNVEQHVTKENMTKWRMKVYICSIKLCSYGLTEVMATFYKTLEVKHRNNG